MYRPPHASLVAKVITLTLTLVTHRVLTLGTPLTLVTPRLLTLGTPLALGTPKGRLTLGYGHG